MARFTRGQPRASRREIIARYPRPKSALLPLLHLAQEQDGYVTDDAMEHIAELVGVTPAEVLGTCSFYEMFKREPVGTLRRQRLHEHLVPAPRRRGAARTTPRSRSASRPAARPPTALFTLEDVECIAACTEAPCLQVNYRYFHKVTPADARRSWSTTSAPAAGRTRCPPHGTLARVRQHIPADRRAGNAVPGSASEPVWLAPTPRRRGGAG